MKIYYALVNTGSPATGFISTGEVLTEEQAAALGEEKLAELVETGVLGCGGETETADDAGDGKDIQSHSEDDAATDQTEVEEPTDDQEEDTETADEDDLPELDLADELVGEAEPEEKPKRGSRGKGGKAK